MLEIFISGSWSPPCWSWPWWKWNPHLKSQVPGHHPALDGDEQVPHVPSQLAGGDRHCLRRTQVGILLSLFWEWLLTSLEKKRSSWVFPGGGPRRHQLVQGALLDHRPRHGLLHRLRAGQHHQVPGEMAHLGNYHFRLLLHWALLSFSTKKKNSF